MGCVRLFVTGFGARASARFDSGRLAMKRVLGGIFVFVALVHGQGQAPGAVQAQAPGKPAPVKPGTNKPAPPPAKTPGNCAQVSAGTRMEPFGFTHVVTLRNGCDKPVTCEVWTDVDPTPRQSLSAAPGESVDVVTRLGSPASAVTAFKECRFR
jgi:hypothetical protein